MFTTSSPPRSFEWTGIILLLLRAQSHSSSTLSPQILPDIISQRLPVWIRKHKSASLLYGIGFATCNVSYWSWEHAIKLFTHLDKIMVEICSDSEGVEGLNEERVKRWRELRLEFTQKTRDGDDIPWWVAPEHLQLPDSYFDDLLGQGPFPALPTPQHHSSSSVVADSLDGSLTA